MQSNYIQIAATRGNVNLESNYIQIAGVRGTESQKDEMVKDDFYTLICKDSSRNIGIRKPSTYHFIVLKDINLDYLKSDFVRFCLSLYKSKNDLDAGELEIIPLVPMEISEELKDYIQEFLPDFYEIR